MKLWLGFIDEHEPAILLLVCNMFPSGENVAGGLSRQAALEWCIEHSFELVELNAESENEEEDDAGFVEKVGVARISEALQTNTWPTMRRKGGIRSTNIQVWICHCEPCIFVSFPSRDCSRSCRSHFGVSKFDVRT